jgi:colanic acid biosynthesis glycosyl transferase WcaI
MRILLINQFFWPDSSATSQMLTDLARGLAVRGHEVYSISAHGGYAPPDHGTAPPVKMHYVKALPFARGKMGRTLSYASFYVAAAWRALTLPKMDMVFTLTTPPLLSLLGNATKMLRGSRHFIWEMDMYPDVAVDCGYFKSGGIADRTTGTLADWSRRHADGIIALGECMRDRLVARGTPENKIFISYNWADSSAISVLPFQYQADQFVVLYSGNLGLAHDLDTIFGAMRNLREDHRFHFIFVGSGGRRAELAKFAETENITSIELRPYVERVNLGESLAVGDIGLVTQRDVCCGSVVPSKVYGLMAAGRPVLFVGPANAMPARIIRQYECGWNVRCGDIDSLTSLLLHLHAHPNEVRAAGARGNQAFLEHFDLPLGVARIAEILGAASNLSVRDSIRPAAQVEQHSSAR